MDENFKVGDRVQFIDHYWEAEYVYGTVIEYYRSPTHGDSVTVAWDTGDCVSSHFRVPDSRLKKAKYKIFSKVESESTMTAYRFEIGDRVQFGSFAWRAIGTVDGQRFAEFPSKFPILTHVKVKWDCAASGSTWVDLQNGPALEILAEVQKIAAPESDGPVSDSLEIRVILHTANGDVVTTFPAALQKEAELLVISYFNNGKKFSVERS